VRLPFTIALRERDRGSDHFLKAKGSVHGPKRTALEERLGELLGGLPPEKQASLLREIESGVFADGEISMLRYVEHQLRLNLRNSMYRQDRLGNPARQFYRSVAPFLVTDVADRTRRQISRASLKPIWAWIARDLLPLETEEYMSAIKTAAGISDAEGCERAARIFREKALHRIRPMLADSNHREKALARLAAYTAPPDVLDDLNLILAIWSAAAR
jgi:hypothetical protein